MVRNPAHETSKCPGKHSTSSNGTTNTNPRHETTTSKKSRLYTILASLILGYAVKYIEVLAWPNVSIRKSLGKTAGSIDTDTGTAVKLTNATKEQESGHLGVGAALLRNITENTTENTSGTPSTPPTTTLPTTAPPTLLSTKTIAPSVAPTLDAVQQRKAEAQACMDFPESMKDFREDLKENLEQKAFPQWVKTNSHHTWAFPKFNKELLDQAFGNRTLGFIGDSTSFYTERWLYKTMQLAKQAGEDLDEITQTYQYQYTRAYRLLTGATNFGDKEHFQTAMPSGKRVNIYWKGMRGGNGDPCNLHTQFLQWEWQLNQRPDILVAHYGLHLLHSGTATYKDGLNLCRAHQFIHYEDLFLERVVALALAAGTKLLLFKTNNLFCFDKWMGRGGMEPFLKNDPLFFSSCRDDLQQKLKEHNPTNVTLTTADLDVYCQKAAFTDQALQHLNQKMLDFVQKAKLRLPPDSPLTIDVFNDRDLMACEYTNMGDGMHYDKLQMPRIRLLAHQINCQYTEPVTSVQQKQL